MRVLLLLVLLAATASAQDAPRVTAAVAADVRIDGVLDEAVWATAEAATDFVQYEPDNGRPASQATTVRILHTPSALVVGARLDGPDVRQALARRDEGGDADAFTVYVDSYNDGRTAYAFSVTAAGVQLDALVEGDNGDTSWDAVWDSAARVDARGWTVEFSIPYAALRFSERAPSWGLQFERETPARGERDYWAPFRRDEAGANFVARFGTLDGVAEVAPRRILQAIPYTLASARRTESPDAPGTGDGSFESSVGADLKVGLTPTVVLDLTVNPDFGQVDADPAELNLSTFETFFSERRPFFLEGTQIFDLDYSGGDGALLYTRRIGGSSPVVGAAKLTGRTPGGLSFGAVGAVTGEDYAADRLYSAARLKQELRGQSSVGLGVSGFATRAVEGNLDRDGRPTARSLAAAADWDARVFGGTWTLEGTAAATTRTIADTPDAPSSTRQGGALYVGFDRLSGYVLPGFGFRAYTDGFRLNDVGRFRQTDLLQLRGGSRWLVNQARPVGPFRRLTLSVFSDQQWRLSDGVNRGFSASGSASVETFGFQSFRLGLGVDGVGGVDVRETRGLQPVRNLLAGEIDLSYNSDDRRRFGYGVGLELGADEEGGRRIEVGVGGGWTVSDRLTVEGEVDLEWEDGLRAWAANEGAVVLPDGRLGIGPESALPGDLGGELVPLGLDAAGIAALTDGLPLFYAPGFPGARAFALPLFGARDTRAVDATVRASYLFSPRLSLQLYGQLFGARGRFRDFRVLAGEGEFRDLDAAYPKRRDFSLAELRGNVVLRWELQRGSSLFVVWSQGRGDERFEEALVAGAPLSPYDRGTGATLGDAFTAYPDDVLLVKLSYLLGR